MNKLNKLFIAILATFAFAAHATGPSPVPGAATTLTICATTNSSATGTTTSAYGQTITKAILNTPIGTSTMTGNLISSAGGTGFSSAGNTMNYSETQAAGPNSSYVANQGSMSGFANGTDATSGTGGDMSVTGTINRGTSSISYTSASGAGATGVGYTTMGANQNFTGIISVGTTHMPTPTPVHPSCSDSSSCLN